MNVDATIEKIELDAAVAADQETERERLIQAALYARVDLRQAEAELARVRKLYAQACARLIPFKQELGQVAA